MTSVSLLRERFPLRVDNQCGMRGQLIKDNAIF